MKLIGLVPILKCRSVDQSLQFYKDTLRFVEIRTRHGESELEWVYLNSGNTYLMLELITDVETIQNEDDSIRLYFYIDDIDGFHQYMKAKNYNISAIEKTKFGLRQCTLYDPDGHEIQIGETAK